MNKSSLSKNKVAMNKSSLSKNTTKPEIRKVGNSSIPNRKRGPLNIDENLRQSSDFKDFLNWQKKYGRNFYWLDGIEKKKKKELWRETEITRNLSIILPLKIWKLVSAKSPPEFDQSFGHFTKPLFSWTASSGLSLLFLFHFTFFFFPPLM